MKGANYHLQRRVELKRLRDDFQTTKVEKRGNSPLQNRLDTRFSWRGESKTWREERVEVSSRLSPIEQCVNCVMQGLDQDLSLLLVLYKRLTAFKGLFHV